MDTAFEYAKTNPVAQETEYPYTGTDDKCNDPKPSIPVTITDYDVVPVNSADALTAAVTKGPVSVAVNAGSLGWQFYSSGILKKFCGTSLDHGVVVVGYGKDYWIVRNSWGVSWGESGYVRVSRKAGDTGKGVCGIQMAPSRPLI